MGIICLCEHYHDKSLFICITMNVVMQFIFETHGYTILRLEWSYIIIKIYNII